MHSFGDIAILRFWRFGLKLPIHYLREYFRACAESPVNILLGRKLSTLLLYRLRRLHCRPGAD